MTSLDLGLAGPISAAHDRPASLASEAGAITTRDGLEAIAEEWLALERSASGVTLFQSLGWTRAVFDFEAARNNPEFAPAVATLRERGRLVALLPLERIRGRLRSALMPLGGAFPQYADFLVDPAVDARQALARLLKAAAKAQPADMVTFLKVRAGSNLSRALPRQTVTTGSPEGAPYVDLAAHPDFETYFKTLKPKTRKNMRNARNRLEREGTLTHQIAASRDETLGVIARTLSGRAGRLRDQGLTSRAFTDPDFATFCASLADRPGIDLLAMSLRHNDEPIAEQWGFVHQGRYYAFIASRDFEQSDESPGKLHLKEVIETCYARGLATADLLVPTMPYKLTWASGVTAVTDRAIPLTLRGRIGIALWDQRLRPWAKRLVLSLPKGLRGLLMKAVGRA
ncbi:MAG TPA: GNAT family N-acetyltransferase [Devosia sp.]|nr:GNAT family N-acetyltransferase [Devosia sp.]